MKDLEVLIDKAKYREAAKKLDNALSKSKDSNLYYLRAVVSYKLKNYFYALEMLEHALFIRKDPEYLKLKAMVFIETSDFQKATEILNSIIPKKRDCETYFLLAVCFIFLNNPKSKEYLQLAYLTDKTKTKSLITDFYNGFFKNNRFLDDREKKLIEQKISAIN